MPINTLSLITLQPFRISQSQIKYRSPTAAHFIDEMNPPIFPSNNHFPYKGRRLTLRTTTRLAFGIDEGCSPIMPSVTHCASRGLELASGTLVGTELRGDGSSFSTAADEVVFG